jgi:peptidoglycan/xylan/chitin deacetylase (PgdA/CDA1 family)
MDPSRFRPTSILRFYCSTLLVPLGLAGLGVSACSSAENDASPFPPLGRVELSVLTAGNIYGDGLPANTVILTYDDGPDEHTLELAQYLNSEGVQVTFFINGSRICKTLGEGGTCLEATESRTCDDGQNQAPVENPTYYPESLLHQIVMLGHRLANHTTDHCHLPAQDNPANFAFELQTTQDIIDRHICDGLYLFRAPYGLWDAQAAGLAQGVPALDKLVGPVNWDVDGGDWDCFQQGTSVEACGDGYLSILDGRPNNNGIFLLHDRLEFNVGSDDALRLAQYLVPELKAQGYQFSTLDALLGFRRLSDTGRELSVSRRSE